MWMLVTACKPMEEIVDAIPEKVGILLLLLSLFIRRYIYMLALRWRLLTQ